MAADEMPLLLRLGCFLISLLLVCGCGSTPKPPPPPSAAEALTEMVNVYKYIEYSKLPLPRKPEDFADYWDSMPTASERIKQGEFIVVWGFGRSTTPGTAEQILVYEKKAPTEGGAVLLRDGTVKTLTSTEFGTAPKAR
jgi:hypothetical protein